MSKYIQIDNRKIGMDYKPLVIAEIGINHNGSLEVAKKIVDAAYEAGCEIVKHQTHVIDDEMSHMAKKVIPGNSQKSIYEIMKKCALSEKDEIELKKYVESKGMLFLSTPFSRAAADRLEKMNVKAYKIGSGECNNYPLIEHIAKFGKPMIVSTGMNDIESVRKTVAILKKYNIQYALLHTTNLYPTQPEQVRLGALKELQSAFPEDIIGLSDHTINNNACFAATALGASILERHFTDTKNRKGPDIICSADKEELKKLIDDTNEIFLMRGGSKIPLPEEKVTIDFAYATIVSIAPIKKGELLTEKNIWVKRPGNIGILAENYNNIIGKVAKCDIENDTHVLWEMIE